MLMKNKIIQMSPSKNKEFLKAKQLSLPGLIIQHSHIPIFNQRIAPVSTHYDVVQYPHID